MGATRPAFAVQMLSSASGRAWSCSRRSKQRRRSASTPSCPTALSHDLELDIVDQVRARGVPWINFFCDSLPAFATVEALA